MRVEPHLYVTAVLVMAHQILTMTLLPSPSSWSAPPSCSPDRALIRTNCLNSSHALRKRALACSMPMGSAQAVDRRQHGAKGNENTCLNPRSKLPSHPAPRQFFPVRLDQSQVASNQSKTQIQYSAVCCSKQGTIEVTATNSTERRCHPRTCHFTQQVSRSRKNTYDCASECTDNQPDMS